MEHAVETPKAVEGSRSRRGEGISPGTAPALHPALQMQQQAGNQAMQALLHGGVIQAKLAISQPGDPEEEEADAMAGRIMRSHAGEAAVASSCSCGGNEEEMCDECRQQATVSRKPADSGRPTQPTRTALDHMMRSVGHPLDTAARDFFEPRFGRDFSGVRIHTDSNAEQSAAALHAHAYALGSDIWFAAGKYSPGSTAGRKLLAHEMAHTVQQERSGVSNAQPLLRSRDITLGHVDDPLEAEADRVADAVMEGSDRASIAVSSDRVHAVRGHWYDDAWDAVADAGEWVGEKAEAAGEGVYEGAKWAGNKAVAGAEWVGGKAEDAGRWAWGKMEHAYDCLISMGHGTYNLFSGNVSSIADLLGIEQPAGQDYSFIDTVIAVLKHPCLQMIPGYGFAVDAVEVLEHAGKFLVAAWNIIQNPAPIIDGIQAAIGKLISAIPGYVESVVQKAIQTLGAKAKEHGEGVWRHLEPKLAYLAKNWWSVIKEAGWNLLWPWHSVGKDISAAWTSLKSGASNLWHLHFSTAADDFLSVGRSINGILGALYGWFFIASVLVGAIVGAVGGAGVGALPGAMAGAAFAAEAGEGLLALTVGIESASLLKSIYNLTQPKESQGDKEKDYEQISSSGLTLGITGVMVILGEIAAEFAQGVLSRVAGIFRRAGTADVDAAATGIGKGVKGDVPTIEGGGAEPIPEKTTGSEGMKGLSTEDLPQLEEEVHTPSKVHSPEDPTLAAEFDAEVEVGEHTYRRSNTDGTWCRFSEPVCGIEIPEVKVEVDEALAHQPQPTKPEPVNADDAALDKDLSESYDDPSGIYDTSRRLVRGNAGERLATDVLVTEGHDVVMFKPDIMGTNQGGIDMVTIKDGTAYLIDNKALSRTGNVSSVSALTTNFKQNLKAVVDQLTDQLADPATNAAQRQVLQETLDAINSGNYVKAVTNANLYSEGIGVTSGVTENLDSQGIEFIDVMDKATTSVAH